MGFLEIPREPRSLKKTLATLVTLKDDQIYHSNQYLSGNIIEYESVPANARVRLSRGKQMCL